MKSILAGVIVLFALTSFAEAQSFGSAYSSNFEDSVYSKKKKSKSEPAPGDERRGGEEEPHPREESYEGNDRGGGSFDGGGYSGGGGGGFDGGGYGGGGGMIGEIFFVPDGKTYPTTRHIKTEDRGDYLVRTIIEHEDIDAHETCTTVTEIIIDKKTGNVISSESRDFCNRWRL